MKTFMAYAVAFGLLVGLAIVSGLYNVEYISPIDKFNSSLIAALFTGAVTKELLNGKD